jgi:hypothetical protein
VPYNIAIQGIKKGAKGGKKRQKWHPRWFVVAADYDDDAKNPTAPTRSALRRPNAASSTKHEHQHTTSWDSSRWHVQTFCTPSSTGSRNASG